MQIRKTQNRDLPALMALYQQARVFMRAKGNPNQWPDGYPPQSLLEADIAQGHSYVLEDEAGQLVGTFALIGGQDPTYSQIHGLGWRSQSPYVTIHRLAANGKARGVARVAFDYAKSVCPHIRIDTHAQNLPMQQAILAYGFQERGMIYLQDGSPRQAYDYLSQ